MTITWIFSRRPAEHRSWGTFYFSMAGNPTERIPIWSATTSTRISWWFYRSSGTERSNSHLFNAPIIQRTLNSKFRLIIQLMEKQTATATVASKWDSRISKSLSISPYSPPLRFGIQNGFSGISLYDAYAYQLYNVFYTSIPIIIYAVIILSSLLKSNFFTRFALAFFTGPVWFRRNEWAFLFFCCWLCFNFGEKRIWHIISDRTVNFALISDLAWLNDRYLIRNYRSKLCGKISTTTTYLASNVSQWSQFLRFTYLASPWSLRGFQSFFFAASPQIAWFCTGRVLSLPLQKNCCVIEVDLAINLFATDFIFNFFHIFVGLLYNQKVFWLWIIGGVAQALLIAYIW